MAQWLAPFFIYHFHTGEPGDSVPFAIVMSLLAFLVATVAEFAVAWAGKWLIAGRLQPGRYPLWGLTYFRWWLADRLVDGVPTYMLYGSSLYVAWLRSLGAHIGRDVNLASRLESNAEAGEILVSHETYSLIKDVIMCRDKGQLTVKGMSRPVQVYQVVDFRRDLGATSSFLEHELPGFSMYLDTNNIQGVDKERVIKALQQAAEKLRDKVIF